MFNGQRAGLHLSSLPCTVASCTLLVSRWFLYPPMLSPPVSPLYSWPAQQGSQTQPTITRQHIQTQTSQVVRSGQSDVLSTKPAQPPWAWPLWSACPSKIHVTQTKHYLKSWRKAASWWSETDGPRPVWNWSVSWWDRAMEVDTCWAFFRRQVLDCRSVFSSSFYPAWRGAVVVGSYHLVAVVLWTIFRQ